MTRPSSLAEYLAGHLAELARRTGSRAYRHTERRAFGARDLLIGSDHPDGLGPVVGALAPSGTAPGRRVLRLCEVDPADLEFLGPVRPVDAGGVGVVRQLRDAGWSVVWEPGRRRLLAHHDASGTALFARGWPIAPREAAEPFRPMMHWVAIADGHLAVHAAGVARGDRALLVAGPGNAGKSTFVRACVAAGLDFLGDNVVEVAPGPAGGGTWQVHGVYVSLKVRRPAAFPGALPEADAAWDDEVSKDVYCFGGSAAPRFAGPLALCAVLVVDPAADPSPRPLGPAGALFAIGPNTVAQYPMFEKELFARCATLARGVPAFTVGHLPDVDAHAGAVAEVIERTAARSRRDRTVPVG